MDTILPVPPAPAARAPAEPTQRRTFRRLVGATALLTLALIMLGAWVRLTGAGPGCPDWPGCYGKSTPAQASERIAQAVAGQGGEHGPVSMGKAWREIVHRYVAIALGLSTIAIAAFAWRRRAALRGSPLLAIALVGAVVLQGLFGEWTVTPLLEPAIVTGHLLGGMLVFALLVWLWMRQRAEPRYVDAEPIAALRVPALVATVALVAQILLGGWTSANHAALACPDFPTCQGRWWPDVDFANGFRFVRDPGGTGDGGMLPLEALTGIHLMHRIGAVAALATVGWAGVRALRSGGERQLGAAILAMLALQWSLGVANVLFGLPLGVAVAHNGGAAALLGLLVMLNFRAFRARLRI